MASTELDKIISDGRVSPSTAMVVFAVELKSQGDKIDGLKKTLDDDNERYTPNKDFVILQKRVERLENGALKVLVTVFMLVLAAAVGITIYAGRH